ncbi:MAG: 4Fe-4S binding protein [Chloroflexi bacterium]|nr:4Fe-4S binding protein [Chloroflexota bacterium]
MAERHGQGRSARFRKILEFMMTPQEAELAVRLPKPTPELAQELGLDVATVDGLLERMYKKGVILPRNFQTHETFRYTRSVGQLHDTAQSLWNIDVFTDAEKKQLWGLWEDWVRTEWEPERVPKYNDQPAPTQRIVPAYKSILDSPELLPSEDIRKMVKAANLIAVVSCSCRKRKEAVVKPCDKSHDMNCLQFNRSAEYAINRGHGKKLSVEETLALVEEIEDDGLVHCWGNSDAMTINTFCSCCSDCCMMFQPMLEMGVPITKVYAKSRYEARNNEALCDGCQKCVERCNFDAISMDKVPGFKKLKAFIDEELCMGCGVCVLVCEPLSLKMALVRPKEHIPSFVAAPRSAPSPQVASA